MAISWVVFDLGGVLVRIGRSWTEAAQAIGVTLPSGLWEANDLLATRGALSKRYQSGQISSDEYFGGLTKLAAGALSRQQVERIHAAWLIEEYPGALDLVRDLSAAGLQTACLSNTNAAHWSELIPQRAESQRDRADSSVKYPAVSALDLKLASHLLGTVKPEPAIYHQASEVMSCVPEEVVFFDDLEPNVAAARAAGWSAALIDPEADPPDQMRTALARYGVALSRR